MNNSANPAATSLDNIKPALKRLLDLRADAKDIAAEIKVLDAEVRPLIEGQGKMQMDNYIFECKVQKGRTSIDKTLLVTFLQEHGKEMADFEKVGAPFTTMSVSEAAKTL
tara:strand:+ start:137 stop:466 length:330 start_codon:yes stop_codon:yes gene_type:complete